MFGNIWQNSRLVLSAGVALNTFQSGGLSREELFQAVVSAVIFLDLCFSPHDALVKEDRVNLRRFLYAPETGDIYRAADFCILLHAFLIDEMLRDVSPA